MNNRPSILRFRKIFEALKYATEYPERRAFPNCSSLGKDLSVSSKTVMRDIDFMRDQMRHAIEYDAAKKGFFYSEIPDAPDLPALTQADLAVLLLASKSADQYRGTPFEKQLKDLVGKFSLALGGTVTLEEVETLESFTIGQVGRAKIDAELFHRLATAIAKHTVVEFNYTKPAEDPKSEKRMLEPLHLAQLDQLWYLIGRDREKNEIRQFALTRIADVRVKKTETFEIPKDFSAAKHLESFFGPQGGKTLIKVRIQFSRYASFFIRERVWHASQKILEQPDGSVILELSVNDLQAVERWLLGWGPRAKVLEPAELIQRIVAEAGAIRDSYAVKSSK